MIVIERTFHRRPDVENTSCCLYLPNIVTKGYFVQCRFHVTFSSCILTYSLVNVPSIWQLELFRDTTSSTTNTTSRGASNSIIPIYLNDETWIFGLEQTFLLCIIFGRWLLPKGSLSRDKLSSLLLLLIGKACDVTDFFTLINETKVRADKSLVFAILTTWSVSVVQFTFVLTETQSTSENSSPGRIIQIKKIFLGTDVWCCTISVFMEELPFLIMRAYTIATHNITSYSTLFFITKNVLLLLMLFYRIISVLCEEFKIHWPVVPINQVSRSHDIRHTAHDGNAMDLANIEAQLRSVSPGINTRSDSLHTINSTIVEYQQIYNFLRKKQKKKRRLLKYCNSRLEINREKLKVETAKHRNITR
ncbi:transmembrane protein 26-like [Mytilus californianus]|uniref:transmembrane protein 26-like n=1 Tax=Mytilus californianus TaxID=6549 RepID=UPI0022464BB2|nr:transmembrane protein 26-like [Mytilus californianus]